VTGVGKTTTAYIMARALMCTGKDPLGCGKCPSCKTIDDHGIDAHPDFKEESGAVTSGVDAARAIINDATALPVLGVRRFILIDEAHRLSWEAWDVYLKILEARETSTIYDFATNAGDKIPASIRNRCCKARFGKVDTEVISGLLVNIANANSIDFELDGLRAIAKVSKGIVRCAVELLGTCAALGKVTKELVLETADDTLEDACLKIFAAMIKGDQAESTRLADEVCRSAPPSHLIEAMFSTYARAICKADIPELEVVRTRFWNLNEMTAIFLKWATPQLLSADAIPLFLLELIQNSGGGGGTRSPRQFRPKTTHRPVTPDDAPTANEVMEFIGAELKKE